MPDDIVKTVYTVTPTKLIPGGSSFSAAVAVGGTATVTVAETS